ncbi:hypothetical protein K1I48_23215 [Bacillus licheniformis]|uniref:hypothetical protein n=1 Tax=Bacillus subtilis group TaxID=653685 RepID=UPI001C63F199|nr:hypothetical protein [Bacillus licheniformis]MBW7636333.1 hypothetical protein [Bacillus licheniformis]MED4505091.1 hypothetical protein [Bacillus licheniformis]
MAFDAVSEKKKKRSGASRKFKKVQKSLDRINRVYPVCGHTDEGYIKTKVGFREGYFEILDVKHYDTNILDEKEFNFVTESYWKLQQLFSHSLKELHMNLPEDNQAQQAYLKHKIEHTNSIAQLNILNFELEKLKFIEKDYKMRRTYIYVFGKTVEELEKRIEELAPFRNFLEPTPVSLERKIKILHEISNYNN